MERFPQNRIPRIYAYTDEHFPDMLKIGYTNRTAIERIKEQYPIKQPRQTWELILDTIALRNDGTYYTDHNIHKRLENKGFRREEGEWFRCTLKDLEAVIIEEKTGIENHENRNLSFEMRPEQREAVERTAEYFNSYTDDTHATHFLWNAKMRFGKTFAAYQLALRMGWTKVLVLTFKPAVMSAWREDLKGHIDFQNWQFVSNKEEDLSPEELDRSRPFVYFGSFQDHLGHDKKSGGMKSKNKWVHNEKWDCVIFDEYHFGAWREKSKKLFDVGNKDSEEKKQLDAERKEQAELDSEELGLKETEDLINYFDERSLPINTKHYLYLSGTPFRAIADGEFIEQQIYNWTYSDEQTAKNSWKGDDNPYASLPKMMMMTYQLPEEIQKIAEKGEFNEFDLNEFFSATGKGDTATFKHENDVQKWLSIIRGQFVTTIESDLKQREKNKKPLMPFSDSRLLGILQHTFWFLPNVASCNAMKNLLKKPQNTFFHDYEIIVCAGEQVGVGQEAYKYTKKKMEKDGKNPLETKSITLSCGKLTTGVSVPPWSGILMLRNTTSPETYFQTIFRVQTPWTIKNPNGKTPNEQVIIKKECYVFDFAPNRALNQLVKYADKLSIDKYSTAEGRVEELLNFLPVLSYDGNVMVEVKAADILDMVVQGISSTLLARRWESALLVNVDNNTLSRLLSNEEAIRALEGIEGFRGVKQDMETIISKSEAVKNTRKEFANSDKEIDKETKKTLSDDEKEYKSKRKIIQEKLIKFATRIPIFMYLSEHREQTLDEVITHLEPDLFKKVTGISVGDFQILKKIGVFHNENMNDAVLKFKYSEDASLAYTGKEAYEGLRKIGGFNKVFDRVEDIIPAE